MPTIGWTAVQLTAFHSGDPIVAADVNGNFDALAGAIVELETFSFQDAAVSEVESCATTDAPCDFADQFAVRITTTNDEVVRYALTGGDPAVGGGIRVYDYSDNPPGVAVGSLVLERRTAPSTSWEAVASQEFRFDGGGGLNDFLIGVPCSAYSFVDAPPEGEHTYRISARFEDVGNDFVTVELHSCRAFASMAGRLSK